MYKNPQKEILKNIYKNTKEYEKAKNFLKNKMQIENFGSVSLLNTTKELFQPITETQNIANNTLADMLKKQIDLENTIKSGVNIKQKANENETQKAIEYFDKQEANPLANEINEIVNHAKNINQKNNPTNSTLTYQAEKNGIQQFSLGSNSSRRKTYYYKDGYLKELQSGENYKIQSIGFAKLLFEKTPARDDMTIEDIIEYSTFITNNGFKIVEPYKRKLVKNITSPNRKVIIEEIPTTSEGTGLITYLPSDPKLLRKRLQVLLGSKLAGNNNTRNEAISIMDNLLNRNLLTKDKYDYMQKLIY